VVGFETGTYRMEAPCLCLRLLDAKWGCFPSSFWRAQHCRGGEILHKREILQYDAHLLNVTRLTTSKVRWFYKPAYCSFTFSILTECYF
jgi:hypothetical protein